MDSLNQLTKSIAAFKAIAGKAMNEALTDEVRAVMTPEQIDLVNSSTSALDLNGKTTSQKAEEINNLIKKHAASNS